MVLNFFIRFENPDENPEFLKTHFQPWQVFKNNKSKIQSKSVSLHAQYVDCTVARNDMFANKHWTLFFDAYDIRLRQLIIPETLVSSLRDTCPIIFDQFVQMPLQPQSQLIQREREIFF